LAQVAQRPGCPDALAPVTYFQKLGIQQLFSRPRTPNDNPYIESHFATIKTHPAFPGYFADQAEAEAYFSQFYPWYNDVHPHTRLEMLTPSQVPGRSSSYPPLPPQNRT
jgi:transposase InsO family protein